MASKVCSSGKHRSSSGAVRPSAPSTPGGGQRYSPCVRGSLVRADLNRACLRACMVLKNVGTSLLTTKIPHGSFPCRRRLSGIYCLGNGSGIAAEAHCLALLCSSFLRDRVHERWRRALRCRVIDFRIVLSLGDWWPAQTMSTSPELPWKLLVTLIRNSISSLISKRLKDLRNERATVVAPARRFATFSGQINWVLFVEAGLRANEEDYYDPRNSYLNDVLDRGLGIPISLSLVYWAVGERLGLALGGGELAASFHAAIRGRRPDLVCRSVSRAARSTIVRIANGSSRKFVQQPVVLTDSLAAPCAIRVVVARMLRNLKAIYGTRQDIGSLLPVQRRLAALIQDDPNELRDLGLLYAQTNRPGRSH